MAKWDAGVIEANGVEVPVQVDDFSGDWTAEYAGKSLRYETREKLANRLKTLTKQTKIDVEVHVVRITPYTGWGEGKATITRGKLTGLHAGTGNVLADWTVRGKSQKEQIVSYSNRGSIYVGGDTSAEELEKYGKILSELKRLQIEKTAWERKYEIKPKDAVENAIAARGGQVTRFWRVHTDMSKVPHVTYIGGTDVREHRATLVKAIEFMQRVAREHPKEGS